MIPHNCWNVLLSKVITFFRALLWVMKAGFIILVQKLNNIAWNSITESPMEKPKIIPCACRTMGTIFLDAKGCILVEFLPWRETINAACSFRVLQKLCCAPCDKCPGKRKIILLHNNTCSHTAVCGVDSEELLGTSPHSLYSRDQAHSDCHLFRFIKDQMWD
jgi:Transposase.